MGKNLYSELIRIGIDEELAAKVNASLDPEYNASKKDILVMQEAIMQVQVRSDARYHEQNNKIDRHYHEQNNKTDSHYHELNGKIDNHYHELNGKIDNHYHKLNGKIDNHYHVLNNKIESVTTEMRQGFADLRTDMARDMASINRQYLITFGGLLTTIIAVFLVNLYFHI